MIIISIGDDNLTKRKGEDKVDPYDEVSNA